jgi:hypothetical protein
MPRTLMAVGSPGEPIASDAGAVRAERQLHETDTNAIGPDGRSSAPVLGTPQPGRSWATPAGGPPGHRLWLARAFAGRAAGWLRRWNDALRLACVLPLAAGVAAAGAACGSPPAPQAVVLAATLPLSGGESPLAAAWQRGYRRAVAEANARGGVSADGSRRGLEVVLAVEDDGGHLAEAERLAEKLLAGGAHVLLATPGLVRMAAQAAVASRFERPYLVPASAAPDLLVTPRPWVCVAATAPEADPEEQAYQVARAAVLAVETAGSVDPRLVTLALR